MSGDHHLRQDAGPTALSEGREPAGSDGPLSADKSRSDGRQQPATQRGRRTRAELLRAARTVFERDGFIDAKITDIAVEAGVATGSLYTYFSGKDDIFADVLDLALEEMLHPDVRYADAHDDPAVTIEEATRAYLESYQGNAGIMRVFEQVSTIDPEFRRTRIERAMKFAERNARGIRRLQEAGQADPTVDAMTASIALSSMVSRVAYLTFALGYPSGDFDELVESMSKLWINALKITKL